MRVGYILLTVLSTTYLYFLIFHSGLTPVAGHYGGDLLYPIELVIHEAGHFFFYPFFSWNDYRIFGWPTLLYVFGGTLLQWAVPAMFVGYFAFKRQWFAAFFILFWLGHSLLASVPYIADAKVMQQPLLADGLIHDWNYILVDLNLLEYAPLLARGLYVVALGVLSVSVLGSWWLSIFGSVDEGY